MRPFRLVLSLFLAALVGTAAAAATPRRVLIDDDVIGLNGVLPLLLGVPDVEVLGITTTSGSVWRDTATAHALRTLEIAGRTDIPVVPGAMLPLLNSAARTKAWEAAHGRLVFKGPWTDYWPAGTVQEAPGRTDPTAVPHLPEGDPVAKPSAEVAALFLIRMVHRYPHEVTLFATGPMTNVALATRLDPTFAGLVGELVYMGGSLAPHRRLASVSAAQFAREYVNSPRREFNVRWDPEAAAIVAHAGWARVTMIPVDPSTGTEWSAPFLAAVGRAGTPIARAVAATIAPGFPMWDEIAAIAWAFPDVVTERQRLFVDFATGDGAAYGDTLSWTADYRPKLGEQEQEVVLAIDRAAMERHMLVLYGGARTRPAERR